MISANCQVKRMRPNTSYRREFGVCRSGLPVPPPLRPPEMIARNGRGDVLVEFTPGDEERLLESGAHHPLTHALTLAEHEGKFLFMLNRWRQHWEVPGGRIDPGESPRACAIRELFEETGRVLREVRFLGLMQFRMQPDARLEYGALYAGELVRAEGPEETDEAERILLWDLQEAIGRVDEIDRALVQFYAPPQPHPAEQDFHPNPTLKEYDVP